MCQRSAFRLIMTTVIVIVKRVVQEEGATKRGVEAGIMEALGIVKGTGISV